MEIEKNFETFLLVDYEKIIISAYEKEKSKNIYQNSIIQENKKNELDSKFINSFLEKNIFEIEKSLKKFVKKINLIIESKEFLTIEVSIKKNNYGNKLFKKDLIHLLREAKDECKKTIDERKIIHMIIDNYLVDNKDYTSFPNDLKCEAFSMNIRFICLSFEFINKLEKILKNYQISIDRILSADYVKSFMRQEKDSIFEISTKIIDGLNQNEVLIIPKAPKNKGFFERFFKFF